MTASVPGKKSQKKLQLAMAGLLILVVVLVELVAITPEGIYVYTSGGVGKFRINADRAAVLEEINRVRAIRTLYTCVPDSRVVLESRKGFRMTAEMAAARAWRCLDRKKGLYVFGFDNDRLARIIHLNDLPDDAPFALFSECMDGGAEPGQNLDTFLQTQDRYPVHYR